MADPAIVAALKKRRANVSKGGGSGVGEDPFDSPEKIAPHPPPTPAQEARQLALLQQLEELTRPAPFVVEKPLEEVLQQRRERRQLDILNKLHKLTQPEPPKKKIGKGKSKKPPPSPPPSDKRLARAQALIRGHLMRKQLKGQKEHRKKVKENRGKIAPVAQDQPTLDGLLDLDAAPTDLPYLEVAPASPGLDDLDFVRDYVDNQAGRGFPVIPSPEKEAEQLPIIDDVGLFEEVMAEGPALLPPPVEPVRPFEALMSDGPALLPPPIEPQIVFSGPVPRPAKPRRGKGRQPPKVTDNGRGNWGRMIKSCGGKRPATEKYLKRVPVTDCMYGFRMENCQYNGKCASKDTALKVLKLEAFGQMTPVIGE